MYTKSYVYETKETFVQRFKNWEWFVLNFLLYSLVFYHTDFEETNKGCCGTGLFEVTPLCNEITPVCDDASKYVFWDSVHPTEAAYQYIAKYGEMEVLPKFQSHMDNTFE